MPPDAIESQLPLGGTIALHPRWLDRAEADALFEALQSEVPWSQGTMTLFGREIREPRLTAWFGDADYTYSGRTVRAAPWTAILASLRDRVARASGAAFNAVLLNLYRDGRDSMGMHADDEPELGVNPVIASVSSARRAGSFWRRRRSRRSARADMSSISDTAVCSSWRARASTGTGMACPSSPGACGSVST